jgi:glucokinase
VETVTFSAATFSAAGALRAGELSIAGVRGSPNTADCRGMITPEAVGLMAQQRQFVARAEAQAPFFVGLDLGGTNVKVGVVDDRGRPMSWHTIPTHTENGPEDGARRMGEAIHEAIRLAGLEPGDVARVGLGSPGTMDIPGGRLVKPANLPGWNYFPIRDRVAHYAGLPLTFANDASAAAYGEFWVGSGRDFQSMILLTLGTGVGCGIIVGGRPLHGEHSHGGEFGHSIIDYHDDARVCGCGQRGHFEAYASATAVARRTEEALAAGRASSLSQRVAAGAELSALLVDEEAERGDPLALEIVNETGKYLGVGIVNLMHSIDPDGILLGGAMTFGGHASGLGAKFLARVKEEVRCRAYAFLVERTVIDFAALGGDAGFIGAAGMARREHRAEKGQS